MDAPPPKRQKKAPSGWASLTPELIGALCKFLDLPTPPPSADEKDDERAQSLCWWIFYK